MDLRELTKRAAKAGVPMALMEKDYALTLILQAVARSELKNSLVFKGGTAIKKIFFFEARFSEDLDFTTVDWTPKEVETTVRKLFENKRIVDMEIIAVEHEKTTAGLRMALKFLGPLNHPQRIRLDFSFREKPSAPVKEEKIIDEYGKNESTLKTMSLEEILAEKLRAVSSRNAPRDIYDIWFLLSKGVEIDKPLVAKKFAIYNEKFEITKAKERANGFKANWTTDLQQFMKQAPPFEKIEREVMERLEKEFA